MKHTQTIIDALAGKDLQLLREKDGAAITYQVFIEPKGDHLADKDRWKEDFLAAITAQHAKKLLTFEDKHYRLIGAPFYHSGNENEFKTQFQGLLKVQAQDVKNEFWVYPIHHHLL